MRAVRIERHSPIGIGHITVRVHVPLSVGDGLVAGGGSVAILGGDGGGHSVVGAETVRGTIIGIAKGIDAVGDGTSGVAGGGAIYVRVDVIDIRRGIGVRRSRGVGGRGGGKCGRLAEATVIRGMGTG